MPASSSHYRPTIAGLPVTELAHSFGTPLYVYSPETIERRLAELKAFDTIRYAQKANSNGVLLTWLRDRGVLVDAVSEGELLHALAVGFSARGTPPPVVFTADLFEHRALARVVESGVHVNCGSADMIEQLGAFRSQGEITLRINPGFGHGHSRKTNTGGEWSKHGIWHEEAPACVRRARAVGLEVTGLHLHIGSGTDLAQLGRVGDALERIGRSIDAPLRTISVGGGLPVALFPEDDELDVAAYAEHCLAARDRLAQALGSPLHLEVEPGRRLVAESGTLITEIRAIKRTGRQLFYLVDAGFHTLMRPAMYGARHPVRLGARETEPSRTVEPVVIAGPLCESGDVFTQDAQGVVEPISLPEACVGELLVLEGVGAYGFSMSSNYNSHPRPAEVWIEDGRARCIRRRQGLGEVLADEGTPLIDRRADAG